jgi:hypothetical protein
MTETLGSVNRNFGKKIKIDIGSKISKQSQDLLDKNMPITQRFSRIQRANQSTGETFPMHQRYKSPYQQWSSMYTSVKPITGRTTPPTACKRVPHQYVQLKHFKPSVELEKTMDRMIETPQYQNQKFNNYNNQVRNASRKMLENFNIHETYTRVIHKQPPKSVTNRTKGSTVGPGGRAFLYTLSPKT